MSVQWGILGCAGIAEKFCASVSRIEVASVAAVASRSIEKAEKFIAENCPGAKAYGSYQDWAFHVGEGFSGCHMPWRPPVSCARSCQRTCSKMPQSRQSMCRCQRP